MLGHVALSLALLAAPDAPVNAQPPAGMSARDTGKRLSLLEVLDITRPDPDPHIHELTTRLDTRIVMHRWGFYGGWLGGMGVMAVGAALVLIPNDSPDAYRTQATVGLTMLGVGLVMTVVGRIITWFNAITHEDVIELLAAWNTLHPDDKVVLDYDYK